MSIQLLRILPPLQKQEDREMDARGKDAPISGDYLGYYKQTLKEITRSDEKGEITSPEETRERRRRDSLLKGGGSDAR